MNRIASVGTAGSKKKWALPNGATGRQLDRVQRRLMPDNWKPMKTIGPGVNEIRVRDEGGAFRVLYIATLPEAVYVLHAFQKKTQNTAKADLNLATTRYKALRKER